MTWRGLVSVAAGVLASGCAYYNAMWSAEHHASEARRLEQRGQASEARAEWTQAASKAEAVTLRHPRSRWADDALVLQAEALVRSGACRDAAGPLARARANVKDQALRERADLAAAECAIGAGSPPDAEAALTAPLESSNTERRSRAEYLAGQAATLRSDYDAAIAHFGRSREGAALGRGLVGQQRLLITRARTRADLAPIAADLNRLVRAEHGADEATHLLGLLMQVMAAAETPAARFHIAEVARDSLQAPALAGQMFLDAAGGDTGSLYAPKALIAALVLTPDKHDSIVGVLDSRYAASPYTRAFHGEASVAYTAAEDSLARTLGVLAPRGTSVRGAIRFGAPRPGPKGPLP